MPRVLWWLLLVCAAPLVVWMVPEHVLEGWLKRATLHAPRDHRDHPDE